MTIAVEAVYENGVLKPEHPLDLADRTRVRLVIEPEQTPARTPLGQRLRDLREKVLASGAPTLDWDGVAEEVAARRGGFRGDQT